MNADLIHGAIYTSIILFGCVLSFIFINITGSYYNFYDIGINAAANSFGLVMFCLPVTLLSLISVASGVYYIARKRGVSVGKAFLLSLSSMILVGNALFWLNVLSLADYPKYPGRNFGGFLHCLWENIVSMFQQ